MNFFNKKKVKVSSEFTQDFVKLNVDYYKLKDSIDFKTNIIKELIGDGSCLVIVDTELEYKQPNGYPELPIDELMDFLSIHNIEYKKILNKIAKSISIFGSPIKLSDKNKAKEYIIGFIISAKDVELFKSIIFDYNTYYYAGYIEGKEENLLNEVQAYYEDKDEFHYKFSYNIFDCSFTKNMGICSKNENHNLINELINRSI